MRFSGLDTVLLDLRYSFRAMRRDSAFTAFVILIVGIGIGASSTIFSVVNAVLIRPLPFRDPERLVWMSNHDTSGLSGQTTQVGHLLDLRERNRSFEDLGARESRSGSAAFQSRRTSSRFLESRPRSDACSAPKSANGMDRPR
jgi:hypothetical protein